MTRGACCAIATLAIAACARTPAVQAPGSMPDPSLTRIAAVAFGDGAVYALTGEGHIRAWTGDAQAPRTLEIAGVAALAGDGSVALTLIDEGDHGDRLEVRALATGMRLYARSFEDGVEAILAVSPAGAALRLKFPYHPSVHDGVSEQALRALSEQALRAPRWHSVFWSFATDRLVENLYERDGHGSTLQESALFSEDGRRFVCIQGSSVTWIDLPTGRRTGPELARDWMPPPGPPEPEDEDEPRRSVKAPPPRRTAHYDILSVRLNPDGSDVYVTYRGTEAHREWRLERWSPAQSDRSGPVVRLASAPTLAPTRLLAISPDGSLAILDGGGLSLELRRAPRYEAERLAADSATAAAISRDGKRIVSGHTDGSLRSWDARTGQLIATAGR